VSRQTLKEHRNGGGVGRRCRPRPKEHKRRKTFMLLRRKHGLERTGNLRGKNNPKNALVPSPCATSHGEFDASDLNDTSSLVTALSYPAATARIIVFPKTPRQTFLGKGRQPWLPEEEQVPQQPAFKTSCS